MNGTDLVCLYNFQKRKKKKKKIIKGKNTHINQKRKLCKIKKPSGIK